MPRPRTRPLPTVETLRELLAYDPYTGVLTWRTVKKKGRYGKAPTNVVGGVAGHIQKDGYIRVCLPDRIPYLAHRMAYAVFYGEWPAEEIDHADGVKSNNRITNLRACNRSQNLGNRLVAKKIKASGLPKGVNRCDQISVKYYAQCQSKYLGSYSTVEEAHAVYRKAAALAFGEFDASPKS